MGEHALTAEAQQEDRDPQHPDRLPQRHQHCRPGEGHRHHRHQPRQRYGIGPSPASEEKRRRTQRRSGVDQAPLAIAESVFGPDLAREERNEPCVPQAGPERQQDARGQPARILGHEAEHGGFPGGRQVSRKSYARRRRLTRGRRTGPPSCRPPPERLKRHRPDRGEDRWTSSPP